MTSSVGRIRTMALAAAVACAATFFFAAQAESASAATKAQRVDTLIREAIRSQNLKAVIVHVTVGGRRVIKKAYGESMDGVPATTDMHFRNGNVAAAYVSTLLLRLVDQGKVRLDDHIGKWLPWVPHADRVTLRDLSGMTTGYHDYEQDERLGASLYGNPFGVVTTTKQLELAFSRPHMFLPGTNWSYAHTNFVVLGLALERITRMRLSRALSRYVLRPLGLRETTASQTARIPHPVLHTYSAERKDYLGIPADTPFLEETTSWNPAWTFARGAVQTSDIGDFTRSIVGIGTGKLLSRRSFRAQIDPRIGFGHFVSKEDGCEDCRALTRQLGYGLGIFRYGSWIAAQPLFAGLGSVAAYRPSGRVAISLAVSLGASDGNYSRQLFYEIGKIVGPKDPPPPPFAKPGM